MSFSETCARARKASRALAIATTSDKNAALEAVAAALVGSAARIASDNEADVQAARARGTKDALVDRLVLDVSRVANVAKSVREIAAAPDPVGQVIEDRAVASGLRVRRVRVPLGVIGMIYEARPNVTAEAAALCFKSGNAVILRGGSDAIRTNAAIADVVRAALPDPWRDAVQQADAASRESVLEMVRAEGAIDLVIPRGGEALIRFVTENARVPVVQHYKGVCHLFVDAGADLDEATRIAVDAKLSRPGVCNALECLLVDEKDAARLFPPIASALIAGGCELRGDEPTCALVPAAKRATESDWGTEFLDRVLAVRVVHGVSGALEHIARYGSGHTEAIVTKDDAHAERFRREADAACVIVNASTRFHDGGELGLGAEIGIATSRLHWRGPMGLESLTTMKWLVDGHGQTRV
ncbi:MAG TPA: glutamate-5-semialdehyde dehydrogenase [Polyangiaceae bacterium]|jgi:glutamate-5-semialdehyde dehydrogenase|nr:glutamate-5-semialdehyde dehydrogenase [Polyangiaceae bacterium]